MNYPDSVRFLYSLGNERKTVKFGLERIRTVLDALGNPHRLTKFVHVAGTNGKGSTCAMIESALRAKGSLTGLYTSPHLLSPTERIRIAGAEVSEERFAGAFRCVHEKAEELLESGAIDYHPTYFETVTAMAFLLFAEARVDIAVLEVGLGGRLDATNVVEPALAVITPVEFDHEGYLGTSLASIAAEKAGILKAGVPAVFARQRPEALEVLTARAAELGVEVAGSASAEDVELHARGSRFKVEGVQVECPLAGEHQVENALSAVAALRCLRVPDAAIEAGIRGVRWPGRLEWISEAPEIVADGAHNPSGARALAAYIGRFYANRRVRLIYGTMRDKAVEEIAGTLFTRAHEVILTAPKQPRSLRPEALRDSTDHPRVRIAADLAAALDMVRDAPPEDVVFIAGSLFLVAEALELRAAGDAADKGPGGQSRST